MHLVLYMCACNRNKTTERTNSWAQSKKKERFFLCIFMALKGNNSEGSLKSAVTITEKLPIKLDGRNYLSWREQVESVIASRNLKQFLENPRIPMIYENERDRARDILTQEYQLWLVQDQMLVTWLKSSLSAAIFPLVFQCRHSWQLWDTLHQLMVGHVRSEMKNTKKRETQSISEYVATIKGFVDSLVQMGESVSEKEHIEAILEGLPEEYDAMARVIRSRDHHPLLLVESFLLQNEAQIQKSKVLDDGRNRNE